MSSWQTEDLPEAPDYVSPGGTSEIRLLPSFPSGELAHAKAPPECVAKPAILTGITEVFYVVGGSGELWRRQGESEETIELVVGRSPTIPPGVDFQYRTHSDPLELIVFSAPRWEREAWSEGEPREWPEDSALGASGSVPWSTIDLPEDVDYLAPDGSEIRLLPSVQAGGLAHCTLPMGRTSAAVHHRTVEEVWYVLSGEGELWRMRSGEEEVVRLQPRRAVTIPTGAAFQFRSAPHQALRILIGTFPAWPGPDEAVPAEGHWVVSAA